eukprot:superscaffoldBa00003830_g17778
MTENTKTHVILLSCGSFNPITKGHIHMFDRNMMQNKPTDRNPECPGPRSSRQVVPAHLRLLRHKQE